jgi:hypothetical protein
MSLLLYMDEQVPIQITHGRRAQGDLSVGESGGVGRPSPSKLQ